MKSDTRAYIGTPVEYSDTDTSLLLQCQIRSETMMLDKLIDLIVFTPRGSFLADPEFGFEYWNHEYTNIQYQAFNNAQAGGGAKDKNKVITKTECEESIKSSLQSYAPQMKKISVAVKLNPANTDERRNKKKSPSKHLVSILVTGDLDDGIGISHYTKKVDFLMEPTSKRQFTY